MAHRVLSEEGTILLPSSLWCE